jgi:predicted MFS family arabinose efflux permease
MSLMQGFKNPWWVVFGSTLGLMVANGVVTFYSFGLFLKPVAADFGWDRATVAGAITISQAIGAVSTPFVGKIVDRWGVQRITLAFITAFALTTAAVAITPASPAIFFLLYAACGLAGAGQAPLNYAKAISAWFEERRGLALGIAMSGVGLGVALVPQLARLLIKAYGWRGGYVGLGAFTFVMAFPAVALFVREPGETLWGGKRGGAASRKKQAEANEPGMSVREAVFGPSRYRFWFLLVSIFFVATSVNGTIAHIVPLLTDRGITTALATSVLSVTGIALIGGRVVSGYFLDRFFAPYVAACFFLLPLTGIILLSTGAGGIVPFLGTICLGVGTGSEIDIMAFLVSRYFGIRKFGEIYGYIMGIFVFGSGLGPTLMGFCYDHTHSYDLALAGFGLALVVAILLISRLGAYTYPASKAAVVSGASAASAVD